MGSFTFYHGTMASGKTTMLLQTRYNLNMAFPGQVILFNKFDRSGENVCSSRLGNTLEAISIHNGESLLPIIEEYEKERSTTIKYLLVDEVQFFLSKQIEEMAYIADYKDVNVIAYGLLTNYRGKLFSGSSRCIELADNIVSLNNEMRCWCGKPATHNSVTMPRGRIDTLTMDSETDLILEYEVVCRRHMYEKTKSVDF